MKKLLVVFLALVSGMSLFAAEGFSSLEEQMTGNEFAAAGLEKLTPQELQVLNQWIRSRSLATLATPAASASKAGTGKDATAAAASGDRRGFPDADDDDRAPITSPILGEFNGWDGQTVFRLENGMIWEQTDKDKFYIREIENPVAVIERRMFGRWHLRVEGFDSECRVKRIQ